MGSDDVHVDAVDEAEHHHQGQGDQGEDAVELGHAQLAGFFGALVLGHHQAAELLAVHVAEVQGVEHGHRQDPRGRPGSQRHKDTSYLFQ